jgi:hypothetical protein
MVAWVALGVFPLHFSDAVSAKRDRLLPESDKIRRDFLPVLLQSSCMSQSLGKKKRRSKAVILGVGLDSDGHRRITTGKNFALVGGTEETHEKLTETAIKFNEKLTERGKQLEQVTPDELDDIAASVGLHKVQPQKN